MDVKVNARMWFKLSEKLHFAYLLSKVILAYTKKFNYALTQTRTKNHGIVIETLLRTNISSKSRDRITSKSRAYHASSSTPGPDSVASGRSALER